MIFLNIFAKCHNLDIFFVPHYSTPQKDFLQIHVLHNFTKYISGTRVYETVNNCLVFAICYLWVRKKLSLQKQRNR